MKRIGLSTFALSALLAGTAQADLVWDWKSNPLMAKDFWSEETTLAQVQAAIDAGATVEVRGNTGENPLHLALWANAPADVVSYLITQGADVIQPDGKRGENAAMAAVGYGNMEIIKQMQAAGADFAAIDDIGEGGLHHLCYTAHFDPALLEFLLAVGGPGNDPMHQNLYGETVAMNTIWSDADNVGALLDTYLAMGADPTGIRSDGWDAFMAGMGYSDNMELIARFYDFSLDPMARDNTGLDALLLAAQGGITQEKYDFLMAKGFDPNVTNDNGANALLLAAEDTNLASVQFWLDLGMDINTQDNKGNTPLFSAVAHNEPEVIEALIAAGADTAHVNDKGQTALLLALAEDIDHPDTDEGLAQIAMIDHLITLGGDLTATDATGATALIYAVKSGQPLARLSQIIAAGVDVNALDAEGNSALMIAALSATDPAVLELLVDAGADTTLADVFDDSIKSIAAENTALANSPVLERL